MNKNKTKMIYNKKSINIFLKSYNKNMKLYILYLCVHFEVSFGFINTRFISNFIAIMSYFFIVYIHRRIIR